MSKNKQPSLKPAADEQPLTAIIEPSGTIPAPDPAREVQPAKEGAAGEPRIREIAREVTAAILQDTRPYVERTTRDIAADEATKVLMGPEVEEHMRTLARQEITRALIELRGAVKILDDAVRRPASDAAEAQARPVVTQDAVIMDLDRMWRERLIKLAEAKGEAPAAFLEELIRRAWVSAGSTGKHKG
jgi:hypothetical protein